MSGGFFSEESHVSCLLYFQIIFVHEVCEFAGFLGGYAAGKGAPHGRRKLTLPKASTCCRLRRAKKLPCNETGCGDALVFLKWFVMQERFWDLQYRSQRTMDLLHGS